MVADEVIYVTLGLSAASLILLIIFFLRVGSLITKKISEIASKLEQTEGAVLSGVSDLASKVQAPPEVKVPQEPGGITGSGAGIAIEGGLGGQVGAGGGGGVRATGGESTEALQAGKRYKYIMDPVTRKMKLVPAD